MATGTGELITMAIIVISWLALSISLFRASHDQETAQPRAIDNPSRGTYPIPFGPVNRWAGEPREHHTSLDNA